MKYVIVFPCDQTISYFVDFLTKEQIDSYKAKRYHEIFGSRSIVGDEFPDETISHLEAKLFFSYGEAKNILNKILSMVKATEKIHFLWIRTGEYGWIEEVEDEKEFRGRPDTW